MPSDVEKIIAEIERKAALMLRVGLRARVKETAAEDFAHRFFRAFDETHCDGLAAHQWGDQISRGQGTHLFEDPGTGQAAGGAPHPGRGPQANGPGLAPQLTEEERKLPPAERMTLFRDREAKQAEAKTQGGQH